MSGCLFRVSRKAFAFLIKGGKDTVGRALFLLPVLNPDVLAGGAPFDPLANTSTSYTDNSEDLVESLPQP